MGPFLAPEGFRAPSPWSLVKELTLGQEISRAAGRGVVRRTHRRVDPDAQGEPVLLLPGFLAGDYSLKVLARTLRDNGYRTYGSSIRTNVSCVMSRSLDLESRLEAISAKRGTRVRIVGHSLGGMLARGLAVRRPDLVAGIVTMGSPMMAPGTAHPVLRSAAELLTILNSVGVPGVMSRDCIGGECARSAFDESRSALVADVDFGCLYSKTDGFVDWRACVDPVGVPIEVRVSHIGMAVDPRVHDRVLAELERQRVATAVRGRTLDLTAG